MLKPCRVTKVKVFFLVLVFVFNFDLFEFSAAILEKALLSLVLCPEISGDTKMTRLLLKKDRVTGRIIFCKLNGYSSYYRSFADILLNLRYCMFITLVVRISTMTMFLHSIRGFHV